MIYIGIPVHDERHTIGPLLWRIREVLADRRRDFHVIVVDDASGDGTGAVLEPYEHVLPLTRLTNDERRGYAASLERIVREAVGSSGYPKRDALVTLQADFTDSPEAIPEMVRRFEGGVDLVLGTAAEEAEGEDGEEGGDGPEPAPRPVRFARLGARLLARSLPNPGAVGDPFGTFRLYRLFTLARALSDLPPDDGRLLRHEGWAANAELLLAVWPHVRQVEEVPAAPRYGRRYRQTRFRPLSQVLELRRASRDPRIRRLGKRAAVGTAGS